jgi:probable rRNA maturation factor
VQYATRARGVPPVTAFRKWASAALQNEATVTVRVVGRAETFVFNGEPPYHGDMALCAPVVAQEARAQGKSLDAHYAHLTVHGMLHLQGYEHEREPDAVEMERLEKRILKRLGYPDPYAAPRHHGRSSQ